MVTHWWSRCSATSRTHFVWKCANSSLKVLLWSSNYPQILSMPSLRIQYLVFVRNCGLHLMVVLVALEVGAWQPKLIHILLLLESSCSFGTLWTEKTASARTNILSSTTVLRRSILGLLNRNLLHMLLRVLLLGENCVRKWILRNIVILLWLRGWRRRLIVVLTCIAPLHNTGWFHKHITEITGRIVPRLLHCIS